MARIQNLDLSASQNFTEENFAEETVTVPPRRMFKTPDCWTTMMGNEEVEIEVYNLLNLTEYPVAGDVFTSLDHHNVVKIRKACFNINDVNPLNLLIREAGMISLGDFLSSQNATLSELEQIDIFLKACNGLRYIHEKGIIHCSIGLQSIALMRNESGGFTVKLKDFRRARMEGDSSVSERPLHPWVASGPFSKFAPPEARKCRKMYYTRQIDVYLLGIAMLEVATWRKISWFRHLFKYRGDPKDIAQKKSDQPFRDIIMECLKDDPKKRATSANVFSKLRQEEMTLSLKLALEGNTSITTSVVRILFIGPPEVGKSSLKHVLVHNKPKEIKTSTAMIESPDFVRVTSDQCIVPDTNSIPSSMESNWELVNERAMITAIQDKALTEKPPKENLQRNPHSLSTDTGVLGTTSQQPSNGCNLSTSARYPPNISCQNVMNGRYIQDPSFQDEGVSTSESTAQIEEFDDHGTLDMWNIALEEVRKTYDCDIPEFKLEETQLVHILDTGGQPCFHDVLSVFLDVPCTCALVFKSSAAEKFDQKANIAFRYETNQERLSTDATQNSICDGLEGHSPQSPNTEPINLMFSVELEGPSHEIRNDNSDLGVEGAHPSPKKLQSISEDHQSIEMETKTPLFHDPRMGSHAESSLNSETGLQTPGIGLESPEAQRFETIGSSPHSPQVGTESQHSQMKSPHTPKVGTESQHSQMKSPHTPKVGTESQHSRMKSPHTPEVGTESQHSQMKSPHTPEYGTESQHSRMKSPHTPEFGTESQQSQMKNPHTPEVGTESQHSRMTSPHTPEVGTESQHSQMTSPHTPEVGTENQHSRMTSPHTPEFGTESQHSQMKSPHTPEVGTESQHSRMKSPHTPEVGTESHHGLGLGTKRLQSSEMGTEGQHGHEMKLRGLHSPELETENQHGLGMETKSLHNPEMGSKGHCRLEMRTKSPHNLEIETEGQHRLKMGTNSSHESGMATESQCDQLTSPHRFKKETENQHSLGMRTRSPDRCETGQETEAHGPCNPEIGTDSQHQPAVGCKRSVLTTDQKELQMLQRLCSTIQAMRLKKFGNLAKLCGIQHEPKPRICLIGTFKDEILESSLPEARSKIEAAFKEYLESRNLSRSVLKDKENFFFLLNALESMEDPEHAEYINNLRKSLSKSESAIKIRIPLMWYQLQEITSRVSPHFVKYRLLKSFAIKNSFCSNSSDQSQSFRTFVRLFHLLGFYAYFDLPDTPDDRNWICTDATIFYQQVSKLLAVQFIPDEDLRPSTKRFKKTGLLVHHTQAVDSESNDYVKDLCLDTTMDLDWFFSVLCHLGIAAKLEQGQQQSRVYFIPAALPERDGSIYTFPASVPPICISLKLQDNIASQHHYTLPQGIFAQVAVKFLNTLEGCKPCTADKNFRGSIKFRCNKYNALIQLTEVASHIEVAIQVQEPFYQENSLTNGMEQLHTFFSQVRRLMKSVTDDICDRQYPGIKNKDETKVIYGFPCCCEKATVEPHLAEVCDFEEDSESIVSMVCIKEGMQEQYQTLSTEQRLWFTSARTGNMEIIPHSQAEKGQMLKYLSLSKKQSSSVGSSSSMSKLYDDTLVQTLPDVRCKISLDDLLPRLEVPRGFMTQAEKNLVLVQRAEQEKVDKIFEILRKKSDQDVDRFIAILNESGNETCARILQQKLDPKKMFKEMPNRSKHQSLYHSVSTSHFQGSPLSPTKLTPQSQSFPSINDGYLVHSPFQ